MTLISPPAYLQAGTYDALKDRQYIVSHKYYPFSGDPLRARGGILPNTVNVEAGVSVAGRDVSIGAFRAVVTNLFAAAAGDYEVFSPNVETRTVGVSSPTLNRIDTIGVLIRDAFYSGAANDVDVVILPGTPTGGVPSAPTRPAGFMPLYDLTMLANATSPTITDLRKRTGVAGTPLVPFINQIGEAGVYPGETRFLPASGSMPMRMIVWGADGLWHGLQPFALTMGSWVISSATTDRIIASLSIPDPGYNYRLLWSGAVWAGLDGNNGFRFAPRLGVSSGGTILGGQGGVEIRDPDNTFNGANSIPITGYTTFDLSGAQTCSLWAQRKFGAGTQGLSIASESAVSCLVMPV